MRTTLLLLLLGFDVQEVPYKPASAYEANLQYEFKNRPSADTNTVNFNETVKERERRASNSSLPFAGINLTVIELEPEVKRVKIVDNNGITVLSRKVKVGDVITFPMGFTDDMKDRVKAYQFFVYFVTDSKNPVNRIVFFVDRNGDFLINEEKRGRF
ncbi:MAG: hypothetical protein JNM57_07235 [Cyclobacteriaceae bacterium]|nr:hypothetical protein [Cyclobacteriaceae bacterium]